MGWQESARKAMVGEKVLLETTGGECWFRPRKWSTATTDAIGELQRRYMRDNREKLKGQKEYEKRLVDEGKTLEQADPLELIQFVAEAGADFRPEIYRLALADGIGEHNFGDESGGLIGGGKAFDEKTIEEIIAWDPLATEMFVAMNRFNFPLAKGNAPTSQT